MTTIEWTIACSFFLQGIMSLGAVFLRIDQKYPLPLVITPLVLAILAVALSVLRLSV